MFERKTVHAAVITRPAGSSVRGLLKMSTKLLRPEIDSIIITVHNLNVTGFIEQMIVGLA
jgi:hypothetical protein